MVEIILALVIAGILVIEVILEIIQDIIWERKIWKKKKHY